MMSTCILMTPFPPFGWVFVVGVLSYCLVCCGVGGFVLGVVVTVGYCPTGSSNVGKPPLGGTNPSTKHLRKTGINKSIAMKPTQWRNPTLKGETCQVVSPWRLQRWLGILAGLLDRADEGSLFTVNTKTERKGLTESGRG